jgi:hypothetical protein
MARLVAAFALVLLTVGFLGAYLYTHRYQVSADNRMVYVIDQWEGQIDVYGVADKNERFADLKLHHITSSPLEED